MPDQHESWGAGRTEVLLDEDFVAAASYREPSARERSAAARRAVKEGKQAIRRQRRKQRAARFRTHRRALIAVVVLVAAVAWTMSGLGDATPAPPRATTIRAAYALPSDVAEDPGMVPAIRNEIDIVQRWFKEQTGDRRLRMSVAGGDVVVDIQHLKVPAAELRDRSDAAGLVEDELRPADGWRENEIHLVFVPVTFSAQVRCGEGSSVAAIVWTGSCRIQTSSASRSFGDGTTFVIAHELMHALGAVAPCAPHYGQYGHVVDNPRDLLYDGPHKADPHLAQLDPGHDDYFKIPGSSPCTDVALNPAWVKG
jgi:hypothetical protein